MVLDNTTAFANHDPLIGVHSRDGLHLAQRAVRPADRQIRFGGVAHAEVDSEISLGDVVSPTADLIDLLPLAHLKRQSRTDGGRPEAVTARTSRALPLAPKFFNKEGGSKRLTTTTSCEPSLSRSPTAIPRDACFAVMPGPPVEDIS